MSPTVNALWISHCNEFIWYEYQSESSSSFILKTSISSSVHFSSTVHIFQANLGLRVCPYEVSPWKLPTQAPNQALSCDHPNILTKSSYCSLRSHPATSTFLQAQARHRPSQARPCQAPNHPHSRCPNHLNQPGLVITTWVKLCKPKRLWKIHTSLSSFLSFKAFYLLRHYTHPSHHHSLGPLDLSRQWRFSAFIPHVSVTYVNILCTQALYISFLLLCGMIHHKLQI